MTDIEELCSGCNLYEYYIKKGINKYACIGLEKKDINCPCQICLIKVMCNTSCERFNLKLREWG